ncbi:MAG: ATP phosphoribosyltransferase, partial [Candidatus Bathyarchaeota archaeon]|nr:ATP phosphoribosyltransferase [Candidatus Bathyarchaeota archaeon]
MIRLALPTGDVRGETAALLKEAGLEVSGYAAGSRAYRLRTEGREEVRVRLFRQKDIPIQIALGNYDLGICGLAWVEELLRRYPSEAIVRVCDLGIDRGGLYLAAADGRRALAGPARGLRIVSEYANLAETVAVGLRLPAYRILPVWGAAEAYPPEDAELALLAAPDEETLRSWGLRPLQRVLETSAWLVANRDSLAHRDLTPVLGALLTGRPMIGEPQFCLPRRLPAKVIRAASAMAERETVRLALPDGHQQPHAVAALAAAGLRFPGYEKDKAVRRPTSTVEGLEVKLIRPQDMPQQVALGSFDLAITGRDWLLDHLQRFPSSPVEEVADL